jgi:hypothetical protein
VLPKYEYDALDDVAVDTADEKPVRGINRIEAAPYVGIIPMSYVIT